MCLYISFRNILLSSANEILQRAKLTLDLESQAITEMQNRLGDDFVNSVLHIAKSQSRVIITGIGKSAAIATKIVATLNSTGTPAVFMHAADAIHGDLGTIQTHDTIICISKSGDTPEIKALIPLLKRGNNTLIAITGKPNSYLGTQAKYVLNTYVEKEACPNNLAPTTSTTAQLAMGDALAVCVLELKGFDSDDFAKYHPGGALGKKLYLTVADLCVENLKPEVSDTTSVKEVILEISKKMLGVSPVIKNGEIIGIITDGDIRRMLNAHDDISSLVATDIMTTQPVTISPNSLAVRALEIMQVNKISQIIVVDNQEYIGVVHLHNLIKEGIV